MKNLKIGQFIGTTGCGGAETMMVNLTRYLLSEELDVSVICLKNSWVYSKCIELNIPFIPLSDTLKYWWEQVRALPVYTYYFRKFLQQHNIGLLHSHLYKASIENALACYIQGIPHIATAHDSYTITEKKSRAKWLKMAQLLGTRLVSVSESIRNDYGVPNISVINNGMKYIPALPSTRKEIRNNLDISDDIFLVISVARLIPLKRLDYLINAIHRIVKIKNYNKIHLLIVGNGTEHLNLKNRIDILDLNKHITLLGFRDDVGDLLIASDLFVLSSETEGLSCAIQEAMFASLPIIATDVGGNNELVINDYNGKLIPLTDDVNVLADAIFSIATADTARIAYMSESSNFLVNSRFTIEKMSDDYIKLYEEVI